MIPQSLAILGVVGSAMWRSLSALYDQACNEIKIKSYYGTNKYGILFAFMANPAYEVDIMVDI